MHRGSRPDVGDLAHMHWEILYGENLLCFFWSLKDRSSSWQTWSTCLKDPSVFLLGIKGGGWRAMLLMSQTSPQRQLLTSTLNWPRQSLSKQVETAVPLSSPTLPPVVGTRDHTATFTSAPLRSGCMHWGCTTLCLPTGSLELTPPMSLGSQVTAKFYWEAYSWAGSGVGRQACS